MFPIGVSCLAHRRWLRIYSLVSRGTAEHWDLKRRPSCTLNLRLWRWFFLKVTPGGRFCWFCFYCSYAPFCCPAHKTTQLSFMCPFSDLDSVSCGVCVCVCVCVCKPTSLWDTLTSWLSVITNVCMIHLGGKSAILGNNFHFVEASWGLYKEINCWLGLMVEKDLGSSTTFPLFRLLLKYKSIKRGLSGC